MLTLYADESGTHQDDDRMCVAGYMGNDSQWKIFPREWKEAIFPRPNLHLRKLGFKSDKERRMLERAGIVPKNCGLTPTFGGLRKRDYRDIVFGTAEEAVMNGYTMCSYAMVFNALRVVPDDDRLEVVFECPSQKSFPVYLSAAMQVISETDHPELLMKDGRSKLASWRFVPPGSTILTESADYFAYALFQAWKDPESKRSLWCKPILSAHGNKGVGCIWKREQIREVMFDKPLKDLFAPEFRVFVEAVRRTVSSKEFLEFTKGMKKILQADPAKVKAELERQTRANTAERKARGEHKRGKKPNASGAAPASSDGV